MDWFRARPEDAKQIESFLRRTEPYCVNLCELYITKGRKLLEEGAFLIGCDRNQTAGIIGTDNKGHIFPMLERPLNASGRKIISCFLKGLDKIISVMGCEDSVIAVSDLVGRSLFRKVDYDLMTILTDQNYDKKRQQAKSENSQLTFSAVRQKDIPIMFPLQEAYEKEEVLLEPAHFNRASSILLLQKKLKEYPHFMGKIDGEIVSIARVNAKGWAYYQIGGVYTKLKQRNKGYGKEMVSYTLSEIEKKGRLPVLFVKKNNGPALSLYRKLGFDTISSFSISYFC